jgi:hypothetical protein
LELTIPHNLKLDRTKDAYVIEYLGSVKRFAVLVWHRRAKKSRSALNKQIMRIMARTDPGVCYYVLPTYRQAKQVIWDALINDHIPPELYTKRNDSELAVYYKNGVIQRFIGAEDYDKHRGTNPFDVVFDEFSEQPEEIWTAIFQPVLMENGGTATFVFTPKGKNHSWKLLQMAKDNPLWFWSVKPVQETDVFTQEDLEEIKRNTPQALYKQEYECEFVEGAGQFFRRIRQNVYDTSRPLPDQGDFQLGVDLAKYQDWTVITPFNLNFFIAYPQDRFNQVDWALQKARIEVAARKHSSIDGNQSALVWPDATGIGDPIVEDLKSRGLRIGGENGEGFKFTEHSRTNLLNNLAILLEQDKIKIPNDEGLIGELESFRYELTDRGRIKVTVPSNMHDDRVMSLALSVWGITEKVRPDTFMNNYVAQNRQQSKSFK